TNISRQVLACGIQHRAQASSEPKLTPTASFRRVCTEEVYALTDDTDFDGEGPKPLTRVQAHAFQQSSFSGPEESVATGHLPWIRLKVEPVRFHHSLPDLSDRVSEPWLRRQV